MRGQERPQLVKPARWDLNPSRLAQPFRGMWNSLESIYPMWEAGYRLRDHAFTSRAVGNAITEFTGNATPRVGAIGGRGLGIVSSPQTAPGQSIGLPAMGLNRSIVTVFQARAFPGNNFWIWGPVQGGTWLHILGSSATGQPMFYDVTGVAVTTTGTAGQIVAGRRHCLVGTTDSTHGGVYSLWLDGRLVGRLTGQGNALTLGAGLAMISNGVASPFFATWDGIVHMGAYWNRTLSDGEAAALSGDPYGLIRPLRRMNKVLLSTGSPTAPGARSFAPAIIG